jgi:hypothetical protein
VRSDIRIRALHPQSPVRKVFAATRRGAPVTPAVATLLDTLREVARSHGGTTPCLSRKMEPPPGESGGGSSFPCFPGCQPQPGCLG